MIGCPTHHVYVHSRYKEIVIDKIDLYLENFKKTLSGCSSV